jgi:uncharacterized cupredoxin-like copper-binding protein
VNRGELQEALSARALQIPGSYLNGPCQKIQTVEKEIIMKSFLLFLAFLCAVTLSSSSASSVSNAAIAAKKERAVMKFTQPVTLMGKTLNGEYLFVHDDAAMARGEACTFVYKGVVENPDKLVVSFHCTPAERAKAASFTVRTALISPGQVEVREFQFAGSTETHLVPVSQHAAYVTIASLD